MFYSQLLLSKKGALGIVWMAAHCHKKLKKEQVQQTDISSSVDKILNDEVNVVTHRILAFLLLGVVRIYSKKVEYLFHDCHEILNKLHGFEKGKGVSAVIEVPQRRYRSIYLPKRFELDAFDLGLTTDQDLVSGNLKSRKQLTIAGGPRKDENTLYLLGKDDVLSSEALSKDYTPLRDVFSPRQTFRDLLVIPSNNMNMSSAGKEIVCGTSSFLEDRLDPMELDEAEESTIRSHSIPSLEIVRGAQFSLEDHLDPMVLDESEKELNDGPSNDIITTNLWGPIQDVEFNSVANPSPTGSDSVANLGILHKSGFSLEHSPNLKMLSEAKSGKGCDERGIGEEHPLNLQVDEPLNVNESVDKTQSMGTKKTKFFTLISPESICQEPEAFPLSVVTPELMLPGVGTKEVTTLQTPAMKEQRRKTPKKQKLLIDSTTKVPAEEFRRWIDDPSDLKREKRKVSSSPLNTWRAHKLSHLPQSLFEPFTSSISMNLGSLENETIPAATIKSVELSNCQDDVTYPVDQQISDVRSPVKEQSPEQTPIAPSTPISRLNSLTEVADSDNIGPTNSREIIQNSLSSCEGLELDAVFREETNSFEGDTMENDGYSTRTRMTENYLGNKFLEKKRRKEEEVLNLSQLLAGKTKKESARLFYDILVLKTKDSVDVQQEKAYDDILVRETSKLKQISEN